MAKLKNSANRPKQAKPPSLSSGTQSISDSSRIAFPKASESKSASVSSAGSVVQALNFGALHTKAKGSAGGTAWSSLLNTATSGGSSGLLGGGLLSGGAIGLIGKLFSLFGGGSSTPSAPTPFVIPSSQVVSLNVGGTPAAGSSALGVQSSTQINRTNGPVYQSSSPLESDHATQSAQVVQIVRQALLTSSSLNDVISEI